MGVRQVAAPAEDARLDEELLEKLVGWGGVVLVMEFDLYFAGGLLHVDVGPVDDLGRFYKTDI